jgi:Protein of unknown function (DUF642)
MKMNTTYIRSISQKALAFLAISSLMLSLVPIAHADGAGITTHNTPKTTYYVGEEIVLKVLRGDTLTGGVDVMLTTSGSGQFSGANLTTGSCSGAYASTGNANLSNAANQKGFCFKGTTPGTETITAIFGAELEIATFDVEIVALPTLNYNNNGDVTICKFNEGSSGSYLELDFAVGADGSLASGQSNNNGTALQNIIPPYQYLDANYVVRTVDGRNWDTAGQAIWNNGCTPVPPPPPPTCPSGTAGIPPVCIPVLPPPVFTCPPGTTGIFPICLPIIVPPPVVDMCPSVEGVQADTTLCPTPAPTTCTVVITSDTTDYVVEKSANAQTLSFIHPLWTANLGSAAWIWGDNPVADPTVSELQTFRKQFGFVGTVTSATLEVASDNTHAATLNTGTANAGGSSFGAPVSYNVASDIAQGNNTLSIAVTNTGVSGSSVTTNPAGLKYRLTIQGTPTTDADCSVPVTPPVVDMCPNITGVQASVPEGMIVDDAMNCVEDTPELLCKNLILNGSFEEPVADLNTHAGGRWESFETIPYWSSTGGFEIWNNLYGGGSASSSQNIELDGAANTTISQSVTTEIGARYTLSFDFSARPGVASNSVAVTANSLSLLTATVDGTALSSNVWTPYQQSFVANATSTVISFADTGVSDSLGTLVDNVSLCYVAEPVYGCTDSEALNFNETATIDNESCVYGEGEGEGDFDTYRIEGYLWHDSDRNQEWEGFGNEDRNGGDERPLSDWTVTITNGTKTFSTVSDANGFYFFEVPAGTWTITSVAERGWRGTTEQSYTVTVPEVTAPSIVTMIKEFIIPTAHAAVLDTFGPYNFGLTKTSGGGTGSSAGGDSDGPDGSVAGISTSTTATPEPLVLGEQVSVVPTGAPNTGAGGFTVEVIGYFAVLPRKSYIVR